MFYGQEGQVVGIANGYADARFELQGIVFSAQPARYRLFVEGSQAS